MHIYASGRHFCVPASRHRFPQSASIGVQMISSQNEQHNDKTRHYTCKVIPVQSLVVMKTERIKDKTLFSTSCHNYLGCSYEN